MQDFVAYESVEHKNRIYDPVTMKLMRERAREGASLVARYSLPELHETMCKGAFVDDPVGGDLIRKVAETLCHGGDCDDYAVVTAAWAIAHEKPYKFVTCGTRKDGKLHVHCTVEMNPGQWVDVDPQPEKMPLGHSSCDGADVIGTGGAMPKTQIKTRAEFYALVPPSLHTLLFSTYLDRFKASIEPDERAKQANEHWAQAQHMQVYAVSQAIAKDKLNVPYGVRLYVEDVKALVPEIAQWSQQATTQATQLPDIILKSYDDVKRWLTDAQWKAFAYHSQNYHVRRALDPKLKAGTASLSRNSVFTFLSAVVGMGSVSPLVKPAKLLQVTTLEDLNIRQATALFEDMPWEVTEPGTGIKHYPVLAFAVKIGGKPTLSQKDARALAAAHVANQANGLGVILDDWIQYYKDNPNAKPTDLSFTALQPVGSGKSFFEQVKRFVKHPLKVINGVREDAGEWIRERAEDILNAEKNAPLLSTLLLKPLGFHLQASLLKQVGSMLEDGSVSAFDEKELIGDAADTLTAAGQVLVMASPFLPPPYNVAAAALGALSIAAGNIIHRFNNASEVKKLEAQQAEAMKAQATPGPMLEGFKEVAPGQAMGIVLVEGVLTWFLVYWHMGEWKPQAYWVESAKQWVNVSAMNA